MTVYSFPGVETRIYHTNEDCRILKKEDRYIERDDDWPPFDWSECSVCADDEGEHEVDFSYQQALREAADE